MASITLHPEHGVNPKLVQCASCGKDTNELVLLGTYGYTGTCSKHGHVVGVSKYGNCTMQHPDTYSARCGNQLTNVREITERHIVTGAICDECKKLKDETAKVVAEGGIYFRCADCGSEGAIRASSTLAKAVRKQMKVKAPAPCGVEFSKNDCPACSEPSEKEET